MSDEALLIGQTGPEPQAQPAVQVPMEMQSISVFGVLKNGEAIEQKMTLKLPRNVNRDQAALFIWDNVAKLGGLTTTGTAGEYNFYPLWVFDRVTLKFNEVVGVSIA
jgi:hypothetical protein